LSLNEKTKPPKAVCLFGPTAVGKTNLLLSLKPEVFEVINADSLQVYKFLDVGTAKPSREEQKKITHHGYDILEPHQEYSVGRFLKTTENLIQQVLKRGKIPVISGGTAFYFKNLIEGPSEAPPVTPAIRNKVESLAAKEGMDSLYSTLSEVDPLSQQRIPPGDSYRIKRALEVYFQTGHPLSSFQSRPTEGNKGDYLLIGLQRPREELYHRIDQRVDKMIELGLLHEIKSILARGYKLDCPAFKGIGYKEVIQWYNSGCGSLKTLKDKIKQNSRHYAKRQITFFSSFEQVHWFNPEDTEEIKSLIMSRYLL